MIPPSLCRNPPRVGAASPRDAAVQREGNPRSSTASAIYGNFPSGATAAPSQPRGGRAPDRAQETACATVAADRSVVAERQCERLQDVTVRAVFCQGDNFQRPAVAGQLQLDP